MAIGRDRPLVFVGDSISAGWGACRAETFARHGFLARGVPGETSGQIRARFGADTADARGVHLLCGINDIAEADGPVTDAEIRENIAAMIDAARAAGLPVWVGAVMPSDLSGWRPELRAVARIRALNDWLRAHAAESGAGFIDYHAPLAAEAGALRAAFTEDGVHLNAAGYAAVEPAMLAALAPPGTAGSPVRHALLIRFAEGTDTAARNSVLGSLVALGDHLGHVASFACGPDLVDELDPGARAEGFTHGVVVVFETEAARATYRALPAYAEVMARLARAVDGPDGLKILD